MLRTKRRVKPIGLFLMVLIFWLYAGGRINAENHTVSASSPTPITNPESRFDALLSELKDVVKRAGANPEKGFQEIGKLTELKQSLIAENEKVQSYFSQLGGLIRDKKLPGEILDRHTEFVRQYNTKYEALMENFNIIESAHNDTTGFFAKLTGKSKKVDWDGVIGKTLSFLEENTARPHKSHFDPKNLPHRSLKADKPVPPKLTHEEWLKAFANESTDATRSPSAKAQRSNILAATLQPAPADLAETIEVRFTPEIRQLADSLGRNPVKIFNWVRNNIEFVPTWGSIQGAGLCLETRAGNAFDTASLLIAMLRYSGIPARYQMGTIEVPIDKFMNWAGGFTNAEAAASMFASGGVPSVVRRVNQSGQVVTVKLEHVWVKAYVDYGPSGGAVNLQGDTWVEMDPSYKQHNISSPAIDLTAARPFNRDEYLASSTPESPMAFYRQTLISFVQQNHPGKTLDDFLNTKSIRIYQLGLLGGSLPYRILIRAPGLSDIPNNLRQQATFEVALPNSSNPGFSYTAFLVHLLSNRISLSFMPASAADTQTAASFQGLYFAPPYLLSVKPVLRLDGVEVASGPPTGMGNPIDLRLRIRLADAAERIIQNEITAGAYSAILLAPHVITDEIADSLGKKMATDIFDDGFGTLNIDNSNRDAWVAGGLHGLGTYYFNRLDATASLIKGLYPIEQFKTAFQATVSADVEVSSLFGSPRGLQVKGVSVDADLLEDIAVSKSGLAGTVTEFEKLRGLESSYWEHATLEVSGAIPDKPSVSTVQALRRAITQGVQVLKINGGNLPQIEPILQVPENDKEAVRDAINAGLEVTIPATSLQLGSWHGVGYIVEDPLTGAGAYQISGGLSGSVLEYKWPGLAPSPLNPPVANRPTAVLVVGIASCHTLACSLSTRWVNDFHVADTIGQTLHQYGYNVYIAAKSANTLPAFVNNTGDKTSEDVFYFIGHGFNGQLAMRTSISDETLTFVNPGQFGRGFKLTLLTACATGGLCTCNTGCSIGQTIPCSPNLAFQAAWDPLLYSSSGSALIGYTKVIPVVTSNAEAQIFWSLATSLTAGEQKGFLDGAFLRGDPNTLLSIR